MFRKELYYPNKKPLFKHKLCGDTLNRNYSKIRPRNIFPLIKDCF